MMHGMDYLGDDVSGWLMSEKLDGCRAYWDGGKMWSRGGKQILLPNEMLAALPAGVALDGEIHAGRDGGSSPNLFNIGNLSSSLHKFWCPGSQRHHRTRLTDIIKHPRQIKHTLTQILIIHLLPIMRSEVCVSHPRGHMIGTLLTLMAIITRLICQLILHRLTALADIHIRPAHRGTSANIANTLRE